MKKNGKEGIKSKSAALLVSVAIWWKGETPSEDKWVAAIGSAVVHFERNKTTALNWKRTERLGQAFTDVTWAAESPIRNTSHNRPRRNWPSSKTIWHHQMSRKKLFLIQRTSTRTYDQKSSHCLRTWIFGRRNQTRSQEISMGAKQLTVFGVTRKGSGSNNQRFRLFTHSKPQPWIDVRPKHICLWDGVCFIREWGRQVICALCTYSHKTQKVRHLKYYSMANER